MILRKKLLAITGMGLLLLSSCKEEPHIAIKPTNDNLLANRTSGIARVNSLWPHKEGEQTILKVQFLSRNYGTRDLRRRVERCFKEVQNYCNVKFLFLQKREFIMNPLDADIIISFYNDPNDTKGWSYVGNTSSGNQDEATMGFNGFTDQMSDGELNRVVYHEIMHALGVLHEQENPHSPVRCQVLGKRRNSSMDSPDFVTPHDPQSVMYYQYSEEETTDGSVITHNTELSQGDIDILQRLYPFKGERNISENILYTLNDALTFYRDRETGRIIIYTINGKTQVSRWSNDIYRIVSLVNQNTQMGEFHSQTTFPHRTVTKFIVKPPTISDPDLPTTVSYFAIYKNGNLIYSTFGEWD